MTNASSNLVFVCLKRGRSFLSGVRCFLIVVGCVAGAIFAFLTFFVMDNIGFIKTDLTILQLIILSSSIILHFLGHQRQFRRKKSML